MTAAWVAGAARARAMAQRRLGIGGARALLAAESLPAALELLGGSPYGRFVHAGADAEAAARGVAATVLWNVRVLAGWLPARGSQLLRVLAGWFEIANVEEHVRAMAALPGPAPFALGSLATAWPRVAAAGTPEGVRAVLAASRWRDPGGASPREIQIGLRLSWADRVRAHAPAAGPWAMGAAALLLAQEVFVRGEPLTGASRDAAGRLLGPGATSATSLIDLHASLSAAARWVLDGVADTAGLWRAEASWWRRVHTDSAVLVARGSLSEEPVIGAFGLLAHDAWLVTGALAGVGRGDEALELFDAMA